MLIYLFRRLLAAILTIWLAVTLAFVALRLLPGDAIAAQLAQSGATTGVADERKAVYASVQGAIMEQALILPIRDYVNLNGVSNRIGNLTYDAYGWFPLLVNMTLNESEATPGS